MPMLDISPSGLIQLVSIADYIDSCLKSFEKRKQIKKDFKILVNGVQYYEIDCFLQANRFSAENSINIKNQTKKYVEKDTFQVSIIVKRRRVHYDCVIFNNSVYMRRSYGEAKDEKKG